MPRPLRIEKYPPEMWELFERAQTGVTFSLHFGEEREAQSLRFELYAFIRALRLHLKETLKDKSPGATERAKRVSSLVATANTTILQIKEGTSPDGSPDWTLTFLPAAKSQRRIKLQEALATATREQTPEEAFESENPQLTILGLPPIAHTSTEDITPNDSTVTTPSPADSAGLYDTFTKGE